jgi:hypothetical protein
MAHSGLSRGEPSLAMKIDIKDPPRSYECGFEVKRTIQDCARLQLSENEQITLVSSSGSEYDITRKDFGYYATPSTNGRLLRLGLRTVIARNRIDQLFVLLVEFGREDKFETYLQEEQMTLVCWLDKDENVQDFLQKMKP